MKRGEVWRVEFDPSVGSEIRKTRSPVLISNDAANRNLSRVVVVPLTSNTAKTASHTNHHKAEIRAFPEVSISFRSRRLRP